MALEDRVKELEDELKVLKNEIQTTLLDIQEQVLSHYYPSLYPSLNTKVAHSKAAANNLLPEQQCQPQEQQIQTVVPLNGIHSKYKTTTITLDEDSEEDDFEHENVFDPKLPPSKLAPSPEPLPTPRKEVKEPYQKNSNGRIHESSDKKPKSSSLDSSSKNIAFLDKKLIEENNKFLESLHQVNPDEELEENVSFDELRKVFQENQIKHEYNGEPFTGEILDELFNEAFPFLADDTKDGTPSDVNTLNSQAVKLTVRKLMSWVDESVALIGKTRTMQAVEMYVRAGDLSPEMHDTLIALVKSNNEPAPFKQANIKQIINTLGKLNEILDHHTPEYLLDVMNFITEVNFG